MAGDGGGGVHARDLHGARVAELEQHAQRAQRGDERVMRLHRQPDGALRERGLRRRQVAGVPVHRTRVVRPGRR